MASITLEAVGGFPRTPHCVTAGEQDKAGCGGRHSSRYVTKQLAAAQRGLALGEARRGRTAAH